MTRTALLLTCTLAAASPVNGAQNCGERDRVLSLLTERYGETRRSMGLSSDNRLLELFASDATGSWTITLTTPEGTTSLIASGQSFETLAPQITPSGDPA
ncbi:MAG: hypothetical protein HUJ27_13345 [Rhodobacteraceae bacterium]|nr:hypothetical protein [Paracoccaceae bacterium]